MKLNSEAGNQIDVDLGRGRSYITFGVLWNIIERKMNEEGIFTQIMPPFITDVSLYL